MALSAHRPPGQVRLRDRLRRHPFAVQAHFRHCLVLTYAFPQEALAPLIPRGLRLDTQDGLGFLAVAIVQTEAMRPAGTPRFLGQSFFLAGYRVFTRFATPSGQTLRGLRILRSDTDRRRMAWAGNLLTHYNYHACQAEFTESLPKLEVTVRTPGGQADIDVHADLRPTAAPPAGSPFTDLREARKFAGPLPFTFDAEGDSIIVIEGKRPRWDPTPVTVDVRRMTFLDQPSLADSRPVLANAFHVQDVPYRWERGVRHMLPGAE